MTTSMKTYSPRPRDIVRRWYVVDADGAVLGRLASEVAKILRGKHKPMFATHMDTGDHVIVVNARGIRLTGGKEDKKMFYHHSGYPGGLREMPYTRLLAERPSLAVEKAIKGMLPKNRLGRQMATKLSVYDGPEHPHRAQKPVALGLGEIPKWEGLPVPAPKPEPKEKPKAAAKPKRRVRSPGAAATGGKGPASRTKAAAKPKSKPAAAAPETAPKAARRPRRSKATETEES
jgi:large subunit ribosomal protein L13